mmetsp:Transcript_33912/g.100944  ORF Transcript_33912/g.100944 Transcript_33912/m.100944 type:complete len:209 (+) Transcript_33912:139-765(+)
MVLTMRTGLSSRAPRRRSSSGPSVSKNWWMWTSSVRRSTLATSACNALVALMVHLTTSSYHMDSYFEYGDSSASRSCGRSMSGMSEANTCVRSEFSSAFMTSRLSARSRATPSGAPTMRSSTRQHSTVDSAPRNVGWLTEHASDGTLNTLAIKLSTYLHARLLCGRPATTAAPASAKISSMRAHSSGASSSAEDRSSDSTEGSRSWNS